MQVISREYKHAPPGGGNLADHVKILSNDAMLADLLKMAAGDEAVFEDQIVTNIKEVASNIDWSSGDW